MATDEIIGTVDYNGNDFDSSLYDPAITFSNDKYFCLKSMFVAHLVFNYIVFITGIICLISRVLPMKYRWIHAWSGRLYVISMLWTTAVSTAMTNTGLPLPTLISFAAILIGLSIGWIAIVFYKDQIDKATRKVLEERLRQEQARLQSKQQPSMEDSNSDIDAEEKKPQDLPSLDVMWAESKTQALESRTFRQRFLSWKTVHGVLFFMGWMQIAGRMFASNQSIEEFTCYTYPVYKPIDTREGDFAYTNDLSANLTLVPPEDPDYLSLPWANNEVGWSLMLIFAPIVAAIVVGALWSYMAARKAASRRDSGGVETASEELVGSEESSSHSANTPVVVEEAVKVEDEA